MTLPQKPSPTEVLNALLESCSVSEIEIRRVFRTALEQMLLLYYPPYRAQDEDELLSTTVLAISAYVEDLAAIDPDVLAEAWREVRSRHKTQGWPTLGTILDACGRPQKSDYVRGLEQRQDGKRTTDDLLSRVLLNGELGEQAALEGWPDSLRIFLSENGRHPEPWEIEKMRRGPEEADACMADFEHRHKAGEEIFAIEKLRGTHQALVMRNAKLAEKILKRAQDD